MLGQQMTCKYWLHTVHSQTAQTVQSNIVTHQQHTDVSHIETIVDYQRNKCCSSACNL